MCLCTGPIPNLPTRKRLHDRPIVPKGQPTHEHDSGTGEMLRRWRWGLMDLLGSQAVHGGVQFDFC